MSTSLRSSTLTSEHNNMDPILITGFPAGSSLGLVAAFEWLGQPYRLCRVNMLGEMREPGYRRINPRVETPVLITDDGRVVTETIAIAGWTEARDESRRISFEPRSAEADRMHQFMGFINSGFSAAFSPLWTALEMEAPDPDYQAALRRFGEAAVIERHDKLEAMIGSSPYLVGDRPTLADALLAGVARWLDIHEVEHAGLWPRLAAWRSRIQTDPAFRFALSVEEGEQPTNSEAMRGYVELGEVVERFGG